MVIRHFLKWIGNAPVRQRMAAAAALARLYLGKDLSFEERCEVEAALTLLLDDPSPRVRAELAEALSMSPHAPAQVVAALAADQKQVAAPVLVRSPLLNEADLIDRVAESGPEIQVLIASRPAIPISVSAAIAEVGAAEACLRLLGNEAAAIAALSFRRMAERLGHEGPLRAALLKDRRLPGDCRHLLLVKLGEALSRSPLMVSLMGAQRARKVTQEACVRASLTLIDATPPSEHAALVEHLRLSGSLTGGLLIRTVAHGKIDFLGAALVALSGQGEPRVRAMLADGGDVAVRALLRACGLDDSLNGVILRALKVWRDVANGRCLAGVQEVSWLMLKELETVPAGSFAQEEGRQLAALIRGIHLEALRGNARFHALSIAAA